MSAPATQAAIKNVTLKTLKSVTQLQEASPNCLNDYALET